MYKEALHFEQKIMMVFVGPFLFGLAISFHNLWLPDTKALFYTQLINA
ncbi:hypothetical protein VFMJ11_A0572 [Aliivibrio fischeri MJ11]|uniref:Uncharacterized protein n=1 Tax=Aliivibrio fischeri (strain MJ11) TaxID=388396 RepID=B5ETV3_ALIFM|nr:hypothetical protein VFMJ11_A0572 [Aliivibrio fischeri MJ11]